MSTRDLTEPPVEPSVTAGGEDPDQSTKIEQRSAKIEELRLALVHMFGAERRLRGRDQSRPGELTFAQVRSLATIGREGEMTAGQLARSADLNPASVTAMLDHLESANVVQRTRSTTDRRVCNVSLTPAGWELLERKLASWQSVWEDKLSGVSERDLRAAAHVIGQITELYEAIGHKPDTAEPPPRD
jgi:MarR family transcriptional regulator, organic hydroperoxide resistance regulator